MTITLVPEGHFSGQRAIANAPSGEDTRDLRTILNELIVAANVADPGFQVTSEQTTAATLTDTVLVAPQAGIIASFMAIAATTAASGESMVCDIKINGTTALTTTADLDDAAGTTATPGVVDAAAAAFVAGDVITIVRTYTAGGGPTPMLNTTLTAGISFD